MNTTREPCDWCNSELNRIRSDSKLIVSKVYKAGDEGHPLSVISFFIKFISLEICIRRGPVFIAFGLLR